MTARPALSGRSSSWRKPCVACDKLRATCPRCAVYLAAANGHAPRRSDQAAYRSQRAAPYGMDLFEYEEMIRLQDGRCAICDHEPNVADDLDIDHNHTTGKLEGT